MMEKLKMWWLQHPTLRRWAEVAALILICCVAPFLPFVMEMASVKPQEASVPSASVSVEGETSVIIPEETLPPEKTPAPEETKGPQRLERFYESYFDDDDEMREYYRTYCPEAVLPWDEWTVEDVLQYYYDEPDKWHMGWETAGDWRFFVIWSRDYEHCFTVEYEWIDRESDYYVRGIEERSGWLCVDNVQVAAIDRQTYSMDPQEVIRLYQSGEWDGRGCLRSHDWSTTVAIDDGWLAYSYRAAEYTEKEDPEGWAYTGYAVEPWWETELVEPYAQVGREKYSYGWRDSFLLCLYVDVPLEEQIGGLDGVCARYHVEPNRYDREAEHGTYFMRKDGVEYYQRGRLVDWWKFEVANPREAKFIFVTWNLTDWKMSGCVYTGKDIVRLVPRAEPEVMLENVVWMPSMTMWSGYVALGLKDGRLSYWQFRVSGKDNILSTGMLVENALSIGSEDDPLFLVHAEDGTYYLHDTWTEVVSIYLGPEAPQYYLDYYTEAYERNRSENDNYAYHKWRFVREFNEEAFLKYFAPKLTTEDYRLAGEAIPEEVPPRDRAVAA